MAIGSLNEPCCLKTDVAPIRNGMERLEKEINCLQDRAMALEQRLAVVLKPVPECPPSPCNPKPQPCLSALSTDLENRCEHLRSIINHLEDILNRIEL